MAVKPVRLAPQLYFYRSSAAVTLCVIKYVYQSIQLENRSHNFKIFNAGQWKVNLNKRVEGLILS